MNLLRQVGALVWKDVRLEARTREMAGAALVLALLSVLTFTFAFDPTRLSGRALLPGVLWVTVFFAGMLSLGRSMALERQADGFSALLASPAQPEAVFLGKLAANLLFTGAVEAVTVPVLLALLRVSPPGAGWLAVVVLLGTLGFTSAGTLLAAVASGARSGGELLLPLLLLPVAVPVAIGAVEATAAILAGQGAAEWGLWLRLLGAYDVLMLALPSVLFRFLLEG